MGREELRAIRRQLINEYLQNHRYFYTPLSFVKAFVRETEVMWNDAELKAYAGEWQS